MSHYFENDKNLKSEVKEISYKYNTFSFTFLSDNGVFSKRKLDYGSVLLLETYLKDEQESKKVLDIGCGYGFLGIVISVVNNSDVDMIDVNKRAVHLTNRNIKINKNFIGQAFISDAYENIKDKYDTIVSNPPIRVGKEKLLEILLGAKEHLNVNGSLYIVIRKDQGALSIKTILEKEYKLEILDKSKGFLIFKCKKC